jgi:hypothetical protein
MMMLPFHVLDFDRTVLFPEDLRLLEFVSLEQAEK